MSALDAPRAPQPTTLRRIADWHRFGTRGELLILAAVCAVALLVGGVSPYWERLIQLVLIYALVAQSLDLVAGYGGQFSLGHNGLFAIGAYGSAIAFARLGLPTAVCIAMGVALAALAGVVLGAPSLRIGGLYLAFVTLGFGFIVVNLAVDLPSLTNGPTGIGPLQPGVGDGPLDDLIGRNYLLVVALLFAASWILLRRLIASRWGRALVAIRESSQLADAVGVRQSSTKILAFVVSAGFAGLGGALYAHIGYLSPVDLGFNLSISFLAIIFLGGVGTLTGAAIGAAILIVVPEVIDVSPDLQLVLYGLVLVAVMVVAPRGALGGLESLTRLLRRLAGRDEGPRFTLAATPSAAAPDARRTAGAEPWRPRREGGECELVVAGVSKSFSGVQALREAAVRVRSGSLVGLIGPNGSGKTTFLNCIGGQLVPDAATIALDGVQIDGGPGARTAHGLFRTFQQGALCPSLTCVENVMLGAHRTGRQGFLRSLLSVHARIEAERALADEAAGILAYLGVTPEQARRRPDELPYGTRRLVELGVVLAARPRIVLLDEPAAGLVDEEVARLEAVLRDLLQAGIGILLVEHHVQMVMNLAEQVVVIDGGVTIATGEPQSVIEDPAVQTAYLGSSWEDTGEGVGRP